MSKSMSQFKKTLIAKFVNVELRRDQMHTYQGLMLQFLKDNPFSALFVDMGMGKTVSVGTLIADLLLDFVPGKILIVGPLKVATDTWPAEFEKWEHMAPFNYTLIREDDDDPRLKAARQSAASWCREEGLSGADANAVGGRMETKAREKIREELARSSASVHIINREALEWLVNFHREKWPYRTVILDESSSYKDHNTNRFKALAKVRNTPGLITRLHELTATPAAESYMSLFAQIFLLDRGKRLGKFITHYRNRYFVANRYDRTYKLRPGAEEEILDKIKDICLVMKAEDWLPLAKPKIIVRPIKLADSQMALYRTMEDEGVLTLASGDVIDSETAAGLSAKLLQMASGVLYDTKRVEDWDTGDMRKVTKVHHLHDHKIDTLREIVEGLQGEPLLVAYHFKSSLARLLKAFPQAVHMDKEGKCIKKWNKRKIPIMLVHPQSAGHGLNLQAGGHNIVIFDIPWSLENYLQLIGRLARQGQKHPVMVQILAAVGTLDMHVVSALTTKEMNQEKMFTILKAKIREMRKRAERLAKGAIDKARQTSREEVLADDDW